MKGRAGTHGRKARVAEFDAANIIRSKPETDRLAFISDVSGNNLEGTVRIPSAGNKRDDKVEIST